MIWFHTFALPLATLVALLIGAKSKMRSWKYGALVTGCALMLAGLWRTDSTSTPFLIAGGVLFSLGVPRGALRGKAGPR
jgi:hypothetical protein